MRKYRGFAKDGKWVYGWYVKCRGEHFILPLHNPDDPESSFDERWIQESADEDGWIEVLPETVGQQIGLEDMNGGDIYEHDILDGFWVVRFYDAHFVLCNPIDEPAEQCAKEVLEKLVAEKSIITGNIHYVD